MLSSLTDMRYVWDTQNRLLAASSNGYVSTYIYDGDGQRVLKQHGGNEAVYTNGTQAALRSEPSQYTLYANPYFVMHEGERYTEQSTSAASVWRYVWRSWGRILPMSGILRMRIMPVTDCCPKVLAIRSYGRPRRVLSPHATTR